MMNNASELIDKLKKGAVDRCRERIIESRENPQGVIITTEQYRTNHGLTSKFKKLRGGLSKGL
jgi:hypothetical protein